MKMLSISGHYVVKYCKRNSNLYIGGLEGLYIKKLFIKNGFKVNLLNIYSIGFRNKQMYVYTIKDKNINYDLFHNHCCDFIVF
jgi:hypothetical protein